MPNSILGNYVLLLCLIVTLGKINQLNEKEEEDLDLLLSSKRGYPLKI